MPEEILNKLHTALYSVSPLASDRERIITEMGETIWLETLERILSSLPEDKRNEIVGFLNADETDRAMDAIDGSGVDVVAVLTEVATSVMDEVAGAAAEA